ncbi:hypothetical protein FT643_18455 [Ketobacter sp. MCCC 1A13808]|uniref:hypothetical protein n=1 Tax=Ketobacter sp. MCCC 1A13808 TaxID=2602738 RepID=UPI000F1F5C3A|nr:hypothetical protein [Ketobacter sp. MCCC 1A13808]MVF14123.1 hypothetical protein [Ketobacter sp. MCCC 1A13808]RLP55148.1 MAG: hypothetical protein D6160_07920 [Ketobacter sp.]
MSLSAEEKDDLMEVIEIIYGYDSEIQNYKNSFNDQTVDAVEDAFAALIECNNNMKSLVVDLLGGARYLVKGWLKKILGQVRKRLENEKIKFNGLACRNVVSGSWKSAIIISTY